jgi:hypothetical protein
VSDGLNSLLGWSRSARPSRRRRGSTCWYWSLAPSSVPGGALSLRRCASRGSTRIHASRTTTGFSTVIAGRAAKSRAASCVCWSAASSRMAPLSSASTTHSSGGGERRSKRAASIAIRSAPRTATSSSQRPAVALGYAPARNSVGGATDRTRSSRIGAGRFCCRRHDGCPAARPSPWPTVALPPSSC